MSLVGFRFRPSVNELIDVLEIMAQYGVEVDVSMLTEIPGDISDKVLYGDDDKEPWKVLCNENEWDLHDLAVGNKKATYVITRLPKMGDKVARKAGNGTWMGQTQPVVFEKDGEEVAYMKSLSYIFTGKSSEAEDKCHYYLHEYYLAKPYLEKIGAAFTDYVICRIVKDASTRCRCRRIAKRINRRQADGFSTSCNKEEDNPSVISQALVHQEPLVYNLDELTVNPSLFESLLMDDHNPIIHHQEYQESYGNATYSETQDSGYLQNLNPLGLR